MAPADGRPGKPRRPRARKPPASDPIREAAASGHADWVDETPVDAWDPWGDPDATPEERGLDRTLGEWFESLVPPEAQLHFLNAGREFAAGVQTTIEFHMRDMPAGPDGDDGTHPMRIEIE